MHCMHRPESVPMQRWLLGSERWRVHYMSVEFRVFVQRMHRPESVPMQRWLLGSEWWRVHCMSVEFRVFVQRMHRSEWVCMQRWLLRNKRIPMPELRSWDVQAVRQHNILHKLQRWHILELRRGHDVHDMPDRQQHARTRKQQRLCVYLQRGLHGPERSHLHKVRRRKV
jgi:hypothetical protein